MHMTTNAALSQVGNVVMGAAPAAAGAVVGKWVSMRDHRAMMGYLFSGAGGADIVVTLEQARDAAGAGAKVLNITHVAAKVAATGGPTFVAGNDAWVRDLVDARVDDAAPVASYTVVGSGVNEAIVEVLIRSQDLDVNNDYDYVRINATASGTSCLAYVMLNQNHSPVTISPLS